MPSLTLAVPVGAVNSEQLRRELSAALGIPAPYADVRPDRIEVVGMVDDSMLSAAQSVLDAHVPIEPVNPDGALWDAITAATTLNELKAALVGGSVARVAGRPT